LILPDTSAWLEYIRRSGRPAHIALRDAIAAGEQIVVSDVVMMELLAGAGDQQRYDRLARLMATYEMLSTETPWDFVAAADLYRSCRAAGVTIRKMNDCLIAAVAIRTGASVLHQDRDFDAIARQSSLQVQPA
jgi:predicted nucleic acid-binding protein